jgi:uncharacterized protein
MTAASDSETRVGGAPYSNPYLCGVALGLVLLGAFLLAGRGLGVMGAVQTLARDALRIVAPAHISRNPFYAGPAPAAERYWVVVEVLGLIVGAWASARWSGRARLRVDRGPGIGAPGRLGLALGGGLLMGFGAALARGCTSGLALSGGALLSLGSWVFMLALFAGGYAAAYFVRREWI